MQYFDLRINEVGGLREVTVVPYILGCMVGLRG
jgi:hypothetical protein